jgi:peptidoglycan/xylan/chitin deacetylase (PgdA/CDA1 family)
MSVLGWLAVTGAALALVAACGGGAASPGAATPHPATVPASTTLRPSTARPGSSSASPSHAPSGSGRATVPPATVPSGTLPLVPARLAGKDWTYVPTSRHVVALTFDAGANDDAVASVLATLQRTHLPATFFLTGAFVTQFPASARRIASAGFRIGDHTITHPYLTRLSDAAVRHEILGAAGQIAAVTGADPAPLFRFPYGDADARTIAVANQAGYVPVRWTVDTLGWEGAAGHITTSVVVSRALGALRPGEIVLMHVGSNPDDHTTLDASALPSIINEMKARGYSFVTLDALTG